MISQTEVQDLLRYEELSGNFYWKISPSPKVKLGDKAGTIDPITGYLLIKISGKRYLSHRLVWLYLYGEFPERLDHINLVKTDNRLENLRVCSASENKMNTSVYKNNILKTKGLRSYYNGTGFQARVTAYGKKITKIFTIKEYGCLDKAKDAAVQWLESTRLELHLQFARN